MCVTVIHMKMYLERINKRCAILPATSTHNNGCVCKYTFFFEYKNTLADNTFLFCKYFFLKARK